MSKKEVKLYDWMPINAEITHEIKNLLNLQVMKTYNCSEKKWIGRHKYVYNWCVLANGKAVGWNENHSRGWSFPIVNYYKR